MGVTDSNNRASSSIRSNNKILTGDINSNNAPNNSITDLDSHDTFTNNIGNSNDTITTGNITVNNINGNYVVNYNIENAVIDAVVLENIVQKQIQSMQKKNTRKRKWEQTENENIPATFPPNKRIKLQRSKSV